MNDVAAVKTGDAFVPDSFRPILWRIPAGESETSAALEPWLSYAGTPIQYTPAPDDFEVNGIAASDDGRYLVVVQANTAGDFTSGRVVSQTSGPSFDSPTTNAIARGRMLVVNSQFDRLFSGQPAILSFAVSSIRLP